MTARFRACDIPERRARHEVGVVAREHVTAHQLLICTPRPHKKSVVVVVVDDDDDLMMFLSVPRFKLAMSSSALRARSLVSCDLR